MEGRAGGGGVGWTSTGAEGTETGKKVSIMVGVGGPERVSWGGEVLTSRRFWGPAR